MSLTELVLQQRNAIAEAWFEMVMQTCPPETAKFLRSEQDRFANPMGIALREGVAGLVDGIAQTYGPEEIYPLLDELVRMRAVQEMAPSQALGFLLQVKAAFRSVLGSQVSPQDYWKLDSRADAVLLFAFDIFMHHTQTINEIRTQEFKSQTFRLLQQAGVTAETLDEVEALSRVDADVSDEEDEDCDGSCAHCSSAASCAGAMEIELGEDGE
jgi:hypothetical protein